MATITFEMRTDGALVVPATFKEKFAGVKAFIVAPHADSLVLMPQKQAQAKETLADYLRYLRTDDLLADTHRAKEESYALFEDQGQIEKEKNPMSQIVSMEAIKEQYAGEWVLIAYTGLDEEMRVIRGEVLAHSPDRDEIYRQLLSVKGRQVAIDYMGEVPEDLAVVL